MVMQSQPSPQGIASLYMGNPGALQQRIQKDQQAKPGMPPDLKELMALNIVTNEADAAKRQQAMNALNSMAPAGQQPPTVADSIRDQAKQKMAARMQQMQQQGQVPQGLAAANVNPQQPQASDQGIDQLDVAFQGAEGGIVGYSEGDKITREKVEEAREKWMTEEPSILETLVPESVRNWMHQKTPLERQEDAAREERRKAAKTEYENLLSQYQKTAGINVPPQQKPDDAIIGETPTEARNVKYQTVTSDGLPRIYYGPKGAGDVDQSYRYRDPEGNWMIMPRGPNQSDEDWARQKKIHGATETLPTAQSASDRIVPRRPIVQTPIADLKAAAAAKAAAAKAAPVAGGQTAPAAGGQTAPAPQGLEAALEKSIMAGMGTDRIKERDTELERQKKLLGMEDYQKSIQDIIAGKQAAYDKAKTERTPAWVKGLQSLSGAPVRGGLGMMLGQAGTAATKASEGYAEEDLKMRDLIDKLKLDAKKALLEGNMALAKSDIEKAKMLEERVTHAQTSGANVLQTRESARARMAQVASEAAARQERAQAAADIKQAQLAEQRLKNFQTNNKAAIEMLGGLLSASNPSKETVNRISVLRAQLKAAAAANGVDPVAIPGLVADAGASGVDYGAPPKNAVREIKK